VDIDKKWLSRFLSNTYKFNDLNSQRPRYIWAFKTPRGCGARSGKLPDLQLLARLIWSERDDPKFPSSGREEKSRMCYEPEHKDSVIYTDTSNLKAITHVTKVLKDEDLQGFERSFQGPNGIQAMDEIFAKKFESEVARYSSVQFMSVRSSVLYNSPGNNKGCIPKGK
jgi:hypothetical protein